MALYAVNMYDDDVFFLVEGVERTSVCSIVEQTEVRSTSFVVSDLYFTVSLLIR